MMIFYPIAVLMFFQSAAPQDVPLPKESRTITSAPLAGSRSRTYPFPFSAPPPSPAPMPATKNPMVHRGERPLFPRVAASREDAADLLTLQEKWLASRLERIAGVKSVAFLDETTIRRMRIGGDAGNPFRESSGRKMIEVTGEPEQFDTKVSAELAAVRALESRTIQVDSVLVMRPAQKSEPQPQVVVNAATAKEFEQARGLGSDVETAPSMLIHSGTVGVISQLDQASYITDYSVATTSGGTVLEPNIEVIQEGIQIEVFAATNPGASGGELSATLRLSDVLKPVQEMKTKVNDIDMLIQLPQENCTTWRSRTIGFEALPAVFRISGIRRVGREAGVKEPTGKYEVELWLSLREGEAAPARGGVGRIYAFDRDTGTALIEAEGELLESPVGTVLAARAGAQGKDARFVVRRREGSFLCASWENHDGPSPRSGDEVSRP